MDHKRRALVLGDESARHPFLRTLPPHVRRARATGPRRFSGQRPRGYLRDFLAAYCASLVAAITFIA